MRGQRLGEWSGALHWCRVAWGRARRRVGGAGGRGPGRRDGRRRRGPRGEQLGHVGGGGQRVRGAAVDGGGERGRRGRVPAARRGASAPFSFSPRSSSLHAVLGEARREERRRSVVFAARSCGRRTPCRTHGCGTCCGARWRRRGRHWARRWTPPWRRSTPRWCSKCRPCSAAQRKRRRSDASAGRCCKWHATAPPSKANRVLGALWARPSRSRKKWRQRAKKTQSAQLRMADCALVVGLVCGRLDCSAQRTLRLVCRAIRDAVDEQVTRAVVDGPAQLRLERFAALQHLTVRRLAAMAQRARTTWEPAGKCSSSLLPLCAGGAMGVTAFSARPAARH